MTRKRLKWWERRIRERGIRPSEWLCVPLLFALAYWFGRDDGHIIECVGYDPADWAEERAVWARRRAAGMARTLAGAVCSPLYAFEGARGWTRLAFLALGLIWFGGAFWLHRKRTAYWALRQKRANRLARERRGRKRKALRSEKRERKV